jgi:hypothetical protein
LICIEMWMLEYTSINTGIMCFHASNCAAPLLKTLPSCLRS